MKKTALLALTAVFLFTVTHDIAFKAEAADEFVSAGGTVKTAAGHPLPSVLVTAVRAGSQDLFKAMTDDSGAFIFRKLAVGIYNFQFEMPGFKTVEMKNIRLVPGKKAFLNAVLVREGESTKSTVEVKMSAPTAENLEKEGVMGGVVGGVVRGQAKTMAMEAPMYPPARYRPFNTEEYGRIYENRYLPALSNPLSTFSIDVDTASYANARRFIKRNQFPPKDAVRIEELINYFNYDYPLPKGRHPFSLYTEISSSPWNKAHKLAHIGIQGKKLKTEDLPPSNLVFLIDVSGSMRSPNKLPLLKSAFKLLTKQLSEKDHVALVVYAGAAGLILPSTTGDRKEKITEAIEKLRAGGSTAGGEGIRLAYKMAAENFIKGGNNRVILATDGDFNVGVSSTSELVRMIEEKRKQGVFLTVLGFGMGNTKDNRMEQLADKGNGTYHYIDGLLEAKKVFMDDMRGTLFTIAKDVKIQVEFNPAKVKAYRLIGYENRMLKKEDFADDTKDAGELGSGHTVTALYEIIPYGSKEEIPGADKLKYQETKISPKAFKTKELLTIKLRYKKPDGDKSILIVHPLVDKHIKLAATSDNFRFSAAVAEFGMLLRDSPFKGQSSMEGVLELARTARGADPFGYRAEFINLVELCSILKQLKKEGK